jgi:hypothetical protein
MTTAAPAVQTATAEKEAGGDAAPRGPSALNRPRIVSGTPTRLCPREAYVSGNLGPPLAWLVRALVFSASSSCRFAFSSLHQD